MEEEEEGVLDLFPRLEDADGPFVVVGFYFQGG